MGSLDSALTRQALAKGVVRQANNDANIAIRLRYIGTGTVTSVTVVTATSVECITSDGGTDTYTFAAYDTIGKIADAINKDGIFEAKVIDCLRSEGSDDYFLAAAPVTAGTDANGVVTYDLVGDTSGAKTIAVCLSPTSPDFDMVTGHRVSLQEIYYYADLTAAADCVQVWRRRGTVETQLLGVASIDTTATQVQFASGEGKITGNPDDEIIVLITGTVVNAAGNYVRVVGTYE